MSALLDARADSRAGDGVIEAPTASGPKPRVRGLYAVTPDEANTDRLVSMVRAALEGGASLVQYRNKAASVSLRREQARALSQLCADFGRPLIVNDHLELAIEVKADGVHIGAFDGDIEMTRVALGPDRILGVSCYGDLSLAIAAVAAGADYAAFGSVFPSQVKPNAVRASLALFADARSVSSFHKVSLVAIGGITLANLPDVIVAGADAAAIISGLFDAVDVKERARQLAACFDRWLDR